MQFLAKGFSELSGLKISPVATSFLKSYILVVNNIYVAEKPCDTHVYSGVHTHSECTFVRNSKCLKDYALVCLVSSRVENLWGWKFSGGCTQRRPIKAEKEGCRKGKLEVCMLMGRHWTSWLKRQRSNHKWTRHPPPLDSLLAQLWNDCSTKHFPFSFGCI